MQSRELSDPVNPYAPPKSTTRDSVAAQTDSLTQDGYAFRNQLVTNDHFKPPLVCAKLGIPITPESNPQTKRVLIRHTSYAPNLVRVLAVILCLLTPSLYLTFFTPSYPLATFIIYAVALKILHYRLKQPYRIPLYFSEKYTNLHKRRIITFSTIAAILTTLIILGIIKDRPDYISLNVFLGITTSIIYPSRKYKFKAIKAKGEYLFISGAHPKFLEALPHLPLTSEQSTTIRVNNNFADPKFDI